MKPALSLFLLVLFAAPVEAQAPKRKAAAVDPMRFDLVCRTTSFVTRGTKSDGTLLSKVAPETINRYRFDLRRMQQCSDTCAQINGIESSDAERILVLDDSTAGRSLDGRQFVQTFWAINRRNGASRYENSYLDGAQTVGKVTWEQSCTRAPFSGFPSARF